LPAALSKLAVMFLQLDRNMENVSCYSGTPPYSHLVIMASLICPGEKPIHFLIRKTQLIWPPIDMANGHILKSQPV